MGQSVSYCQVCHLENTRALHSGMWHYQMHCASLWCDSFVNARMTVVPMTKRTQILKTHALDQLPCWRRILKAPKISKTRVHLLSSVLPVSFCLNCFFPVGRAFFSNVTFFSPSCTNRAGFCMNLWWFVQNSAYVTPMLEELVSHPK